MSTSQPSIIRQIVEFLPLFVFFIVYTVYKDLVFATYFLLGTTAITLIYALIVYKRLEPLTIIVSIFVFVFGGMTLAFDNPDFIKLKPSILNSILALVFLGSHFVYKKKPVIQLLLQSQLSMPDVAWRQMSFMWVVYFLLTASLNLLIWKMFSEEIWVFWRFWGMMSFTIIFSLVQVALLYKYLKEQPLP